MLANIDNILPRQAVVQKLEMESKFELLSNSEVLADLEGGVLRKAIAGPKNPNFKPLKEFDKLVLS